MYTKRRSKVLKEFQEEEENLFLKFKRKERIVISPKYAALLSFFHFLKCTAQNKKEA
jgi:hypothetical protein